MSQKTLTKIDLGFYETINPTVPTIISPTINLVLKENMYYLECTHSCPNCNITWIEIDGKGFRNNRIETNELLSVMGLFKQRHQV